MESTLSSAGLSPDYQLVPTLNFRNFADADQEKQNLSMLDSIYQSAAAQATNFLSADELTKFSQFREKAIQGNHAALAMNRTLMAPLSK